MKVTCKAAWNRERTMACSMLSQPRHTIQAIRGNTRGAALLSALLVMVGLTVLGTAIITIPPLESKIVGNYLTATQAFYIAEAGMNRLLGKYRGDPSLYTGTSNATDMGLAAAKPGEANFGTDFAYWFPSLTYEASNPPQFVDFESHGTVLGTNTLSKVTVRIAYTQPSLFNWGIFGDQWVDISSATVDSYDACAAPYDPGNPGSNGDVGTNGTGCAGGCLAVGGGSTIDGDAAVGHGGDPALDIDNSGTITGSQTALSSPRDMTPEVDPGGGAPETLDINGPDKTFTAGTYRLPYIKINSTSKAYIDGDVTLYVDGNLDIAGSGEIVVQPGASLTIYISGNIDIGGNGAVNQTQLPQNLTVYGTSSSTTIKLHGNADFYGAIYAPTAGVDTIGSSNIYGSLVGKTIKATGNIHYDECLNDGLNGDDAFRIVLWRID
jgi:hypothetical protein